MNYAYKLLFKRTLFLSVFNDLSVVVIRLNLPKTSQGSASWLRFFPKRVQFLLGRKLNFRRNDIDQIIRQSRSLIRVLCIIFCEKKNAYLIDCGNKIMHDQNYSY